jgi:hypothetical protein
MTSSRAKRLTCRAGSAARINGALPGYITPLDRRAPGNKIMFAAAGRRWGDKPERPGGGGSGRPLAGLSSGRVDKVGDKVWITTGGPDSAWTRGWISQKRASYAQLSQVIPKKRRVIHRLGQVVRTLSPTLSPLPGEFSTGDSGRGCGYVLWIGTPRVRRAIKPLAAGKPPLRVQST